MNLENTDSIDGDSLGYQGLVLLSHVILLFLSWMAIKYFQYFLMTLAGFDTFAKQYTSNGDHLIVTWLIWGLLWIAVFLKCELGWGSLEGNQAQASYDAFIKRKIPEGGTQFVVNQKNFYLRFLWQLKQGKPVNIDKEVVHEGCGTTIRIKKVSLEIKIIVTYRALESSLSKYLQNDFTPEGKPKVLDQIEASANQLIEVAASRRDNTEEVRASQTEVIAEVFAELKEEAEKLGIDLLVVRFKKCDYPKQVQDELNKTLAATNIADIANIMNLPANERARALELAAVIADKPGAKVGRTIVQLEADTPVAKALESAGPAIAAMVVEILESRKATK